MKRKKKKSLASFSVNSENSDAKNLISIFADPDMDDYGEFAVNDGEHDGGMFFNLMKVDFEKMKQFKYMQLVRFKDNPELLLKEDYKYYFEESLKALNECDDDEEELDILKESFYILVANIINITKSIGFVYYTQYEFLKKLIDTPDGDHYSPKLNENGYYDFTEFLESIEPNND